MPWEMCARHVVLPYTHGTCTICLATVESAHIADHIRWHKQHNHHHRVCASLYFTGAGNPPNPCTCPMLSVWA